jgi:UPF0755 protein
MTRLKNMNIRDFPLFRLSEKTKKIITVTILLLTIGYILLLVFLSPPPDFPTNQVITIAKGKTFAEVAGEFENESLIRSAFLFESLAWLFGKQAEVKAGEYFFEKKLNALELMEKITSDSYRNNLTKITIPEGYNLRDIGLLFEDRGIWPAEELWKAAGFPATENSKEGYLFPDTYYLPITISPQSLTEIMLETFNKKVVQELGADIKNSGRSLSEIIKMASILEEEAMTKEDREIISGILWKRLDKGMALQVDAVFPYIIGKNSFELTLEDLKIDSPYNTYLYKGLPPTPITNPGLGSIKAALYPSETEYWYYLSDKKSKVHYSVTYEEHLRKKEKYLR